MINIKDLSVSFNEQKVIDNLSLDLPKTGMAAIVGPSGCGKTTLFNCISGLISFNGDIIIDGKNIANMPVTKLNNFRLKNIGFIFQDFKLFNLDNVIHNVAFPLSVKNGSIGLRNKRRIIDLLSLVGLENKENQSIKNLSGGEKQRVAIARSLINDPKLILADEPTGALDEDNAHKIMDLLKKISEEKLVLIVSHDRELVNEYADEIIELKDGKIKDIYFKNNENIKDNLKLIKENKSSRKAIIPISFLLRHTLQTLKEKKWRTVLINGVTSLGLIGFGLAFSISSTISNNIKEACTNLFNENQLMLSKKESNNVPLIECASYDEMLNLKKQFPSEISSIGAVYENSFTNFFIEQDFTIYTNKTKIGLSNYSFQQINGYRMIEDNDIEMFPYEVNGLNTDEVVMSFSVGAIYNICYQLSITRTVESFIDYMKMNDVYLNIHVKNDNWEYEDEHMFKLKAFTLDYEPMIYHSHELWNEEIIESYMRIPSSLSPYSQDEKPWTLKKLYYLRLFKDTDRDKFLHDSRYNPLFNPYLLEVGLTSYFPYINEEEVKDINRIIVFKNNMNSINPRLVDQAKKYFPECETVTLGNYGGYIIHPDAMMMGFSSYTYFSSDKELLMSTLEEYSSTPTLNNQTLDLDRDIKLGHYSKSLQNGVIFQEFKGNLLSGTSPNSLDEIVVSSGLYKAFSSFDNNMLTIGVTTKEERISEDKVWRDFTTIDVRIVGVVDSEDYVIYHNRDWTIDFYQSRVGISNFSLGINVISFSFNDDEDMDNLLNKMKRVFPDYEVVNPLSSINEGIDEVCSYLEIALLAFSSIAIVISIFLLSMCNYLHALDIRGDIGLARCIGVSGLESTKFVFYHSYLMGFLSLLTASFELVLTSYFISYSVSHHLEVPFIFSFNPLGLLYMFLLTLVISTLSSLFISFKVLRFSPIESLKVT